MSEPLSFCLARGTAACGAYCGNSDLLVGLHGLHVIDVAAAARAARRRVQQEIHGHRGRKGDPL